MKFLIGFITAILFTFTVSAQHGNAPAGKVNFGIKGGVNLYNIHNDLNTNYDSRIGYHFGLIGHIHFNNYFAFQPEIVYSTQGAKYKVNSVDTKYNLDYINIPLLFQYMFDNGFRIQAGPQVGFLLSAKSKYNNSTIDNKNDLKPIDLSVSIGIGYIFPPSGFGIDARYNQGISNINKNDTGNSNNRGFQFGIFYIFNHNG